jgi:hypothetical protein
MFGHDIPSQPVCFSARPVATIIALCQNLIAVFSP